MSDSNLRPPRALPSLEPGASPSRPSRALPPINLENKSANGDKPSPRHAPRRKRQRQEKPASVITNPNAFRSDGPENTNETPTSRTTPRSEDSATNEASQPRERRRPRKKKPETATPSQPVTSQPEQPTLIQSGLLSAIENPDQVVSVNEVDEAIDVSNLPGIAHGSGGSAPNDRVYVQTTNGFVTRNQEWLDKRNDMALDSSRLAYGEDRVQPCDIAEQNEKGFMFITLVLHGALAGMAIWHVVFCYSLYQPARAQNFLLQYQTLAMPAQTVYYIVLSLCVVSALDRYDFASKDKHIFTSLAKFDLAAVSVFVYYVTFLFSIGLVGLDAWIQSGVGITTESTTTTTTMAPVSTTTLPPELTGTQLNAASSVNTWLILSIFRSVFASLGWLIIAFDPLRNDMTWRS